MEKLLYCANHLLKKHLHVLLTLIIAVSIISCSTTPKNKLLNEAQLKEVFTEQQINDLNTILQFFENQIGINPEDSDEQSTQKYYQYIDKLYAAMRKGKAEKLISIEEQLAMYQQIDTQTFNQIWTLGAGYKKKWKGDTLRVIHLNYEGKYKSFLKLVADSIPIVKEKYYDRFQTIGHISPTMKADLIINKEQFDLRDIRIRLLYAIHYLTLNDENKRREKYNWKSQTFDKHVG